MKSLPMRLSKAIFRHRRYGTDFVMTEETGSATSQNASQTGIENVKSTRVKAT